MISMTRITVALTLLLSGSLAGCSFQSAAVSSSSAAFGALTERRGADVFLEDNWVAWKIRNFYAKSPVVNVGNVNVSVYQGKVLLTGAAASEEEILEAVRIAKATRGVQSVQSELKVQFVSATEVVRDGWLTNRVKAQLLTDRKVRGLDIHVETTKSVVYLTGTAQSMAERDRAIEITGSISGVQEVVSYIEINSDSYPLSHEIDPP